MFQASQRVAIYARVSKDDKSQDPENQLAQLRAWCAAAGHSIVKEYVDCESGTKGSGQRRALAMLLADAHKRPFDLVVFWALDRFSREGMVPTLRYLQQLADAGVGFHSYTEPHLATDNELVRNVLLALMSSLAKVEAARISERTRAGLARVKAKGTVLGRPRLGAEKDMAKKAARMAKEARCQAALQAGAGILKAARIAGIGTSTAQRIADELRAAE